MRVVLLFIDLFYIENGLLSRINSYLWRNSISMNREKAILTMTYHSPCGDLLLGSYEGALCLCDWASKPKRAVTDAMIRRLSGVGYIAVPSEVTRLAARQLDEYFAGCRRYFDVPLRMFGTEFRRRVWQAIGEVPYGDTVSYGELAERVGDSRAVRAVAAAVGANPVSILVPCHRIVGRDGALVGYAGGLEAKRRLLELEGADLRRQGRPAAEGIYTASMK